MGQHQVHMAHARVKDIGFLSVMQDHLWASSYRAKSGARTLGFIHSLGSWLSLGIHHKCSSQFSKDNGEQPTFALHPCLVNHHPKDGAHCSSFMSHDSVFFVF